MPTFLLITDGPMKGSRFELKKGTTLGRAGTDVTIQDPKVSSRHAVVDSNEKGDLILRDLGSSNGTWVNNEKVKEVPLSAGISLRLGRTPCEIVVEEDAPAADETWSEAMVRLATAARKAGSPGSRDLRALNPAVRLDFLFNSESHTLGYGPRSVGGGSVDLFIDDPNGPPVAFQIVPGKGGVPEFFTEVPEMIKLNGTNIGKTPLTEGDLIEYRGRKFRVSFLK